MIRPFELRDIPTLHRYRHQGLFLDSIPTLTWGRSLVPAGAMLLPFSAAMGVFTSVLHNKENGVDSIIGQVAHTAGSPFARFTFIAPDSAIETPELSPLLENLVARVGERGAQSVVAEVDEKTFTFEALRRASFGIYARQHIWRATTVEKGQETAPWRVVVPQDEINVRKLYNAVVPALIQQVEPAPWGRLRGWAYYREGELLAFADVVLGPKGIWVQPFIHPEMENVRKRLSQLIGHFQPKESRPVYVCLRSYQAWLATALHDLGAEQGSSQAVMVRRLTAAIKKPALAPIPKINGNTEPTTSFFNTVDETEK